MKKITLILLIIYNYSFSQNNYPSGKITYNVKVGVDEWFSSLPKNMQETYISDNESKIYELNFNKNISEFKLINDLKNNDDTYYFKDIKENFALRYSNDSDFGKIIIRYERNQNWELLNEKKMILDFECYKAVREYEEERNGIVRKNTLIAWYCPEIPLSFGPFGHSLPGLILELQDKNVIYGASSINFNTNYTKIKKPEGFKIISEKEYIKMIQSLFN